MYSGGMLGPPAAMKLANVQNFRQAMEDGAHLTGIFLPGWGKNKAFVNNGTESLGTLFQERWKLS